MSPSQRERDYARRRYEAWQARTRQRELARRRRRRVAATVVSVLVLVGVVAVAAYVGLHGSSDSSAKADASSPSPSSSSSTKHTLPSGSLAEGRTWTGTITTSLGPISVSLDGAKAPQATSNFIALARSGFFAKTPCHRLTTAGIYVLQCGDPTGTGRGGPGYDFGPIENAPASNVYPTGTLAMARTGGNASSQGSQFFIVYKDSTIPSDSAGGYTVFGTVTSGLDVVTKVAAAGTDDANGSGDGAPKQKIDIERVSVT